MCDKKLCVVCGKEFPKRPSDSIKTWEKKRFCSHECHSEFGRVEIKCKNCFNSFKIPQSLIKKKIFCSPKCRKEYHKNHTEEYPTTFKVGHHGGSISCVCEHCQKTYNVRAARYKKLGSRFCSMKCRIDHGAMGLGKGPNHPRWTGKSDEVSLLRHSEEYNTWRKSVYKRDNWTCRECKIKQNHPIAHHIKSFRNYPELRFDISNGITLCRKCHKIIHDEIGLETRFK